MTDKHRSKFYRNKGASKGLVVVRAVGIDTLCQNLNKKSEFKRFLAEMSKNKQSRYARKVVKTIHEEGFMVFARKAFGFSRRTVLRRIELKLLSNFYIWGFHRVYYYSSVWTKTSFFGVPVAKCPLDLWICQEIIFETKPNFIVETGTSKGGSASFFASICELINQGQVITIDIEKQDIPLHPRIT
jgi:hypothetical protein